MKLDECLQIFRDFCIRFNKAVKVQLVASPCFLSCLDFCLSSSQPGPCLWRKGASVASQHREVWPLWRCLAVPQDSEEALPSQP